MTNEEYAIFEQEIRKEIYDPQIDNSLGDTFRRADQFMYENKRSMKKGHENSQE